MKGFIFKINQIQNSIALSYFQLQDEFKLF